MQRIALVTGGNRGLGLATVIALARAGHTVVMSGRNLDAVETATNDLRSQGLDVETVALDVDSFASVRCAAEEVGRRHDQLDILVNNAGILPEAVAAGGQDFADPSVFATTFQTNVFGPVAVIEAFLPLLRRSDAGRIVNVSTIMGSLTEQSDMNSPYYGMIVPAYQASKAALNSITIGLSKKLADTNIKVTSICPGFVQTDLTPMNRTQAPLSAEQAAEVVVRAATLSPDAPSGTYVDASGVLPW